jgi:hypothetical protein
MTRRSVAAALSVSPVAWGRALLIDGDAADALLWTSALLVVAAPLAGVALVARPARGAPAVTAIRVAGAVCAWAGLTALFSGGLTLASLGVDAAGFVVRSHAAIFAVTLALAGIGALFATRLEEPLDAAACSVLLTLLTAGGLLAAGNWASRASPGLLTVLVGSSPFMAMASAAQIDVARLDLFYRISPLAHVGVDYPAWQTVCGCYGGVAAACLGGLVMKRAPRL